jgi:signal transduction histidine kinase
MAGKKKATKKVRIQSPDKEQKRVSAQASGEEESKMPFPVVGSRMSRRSLPVPHPLQEATELSECGKVTTDLKKSHEQLRHLTAHLQSRREEERTNIAREIHDELG